MAHKASTPMGLNTALIDVFASMAIRANIHLHPLRRIACESANTFTPDITTVSADPVFLKGLQALGFADVTVAGGAFHLARFDMRDMRKEYAIRLSRINQPGDLPAFGNIFFDKFFLLGGFTQYLFMAVNTLGEFRNSGVSAVFPEKMTAFTARINLCVVQRMIKFNGLFFLGIK